jgi:hypothetical protein
MGTMAGAGATAPPVTPFNPISDWSLPPLHAFSTADSLWTPPADTGSVSSWRNGGSAAKGAYIGAKGLALPGLITDYATTPDSAALGITGDITLVADVTATDWTPALVMSPLAKSGAGQGSYAITLLTTGHLRLYFTADGSTALSQDSTVPVGVENGTRLRVATTLDVDNGAGGHDIKFWTSTDGTTWTQLGATVTTAGTTSVYSGTAELWFGRSTSANLWIGTLHRIKVYSGVHDLNADTGGTLVLDANFESATEDATSFTESSSNAATVTVVSVPRAAHINANGLALQGNVTTARTDCAIIADNAVTRPTGDMELIVKASATDWTPSGGKVLVLSGGNGAYATMNWYLYYNATGTITFARPPGGTARLFTSSVATGIADGATKWIKVTYDQDNGAGNAECKFYLSDDGSSWTQLGTTQTYASTLASNSNTQGVTIGQSYSGAFGHAGTIHRVIAKDGIDGTTFLDADFESANPNVSQFTESSSNALTVKVISSIDPAQATGSKQPTYDAANAAYNNAAVVTFDGADDVLVANTADLTQPFWLVLVGHTSAVTTQGFVGVGVVSTNRRFGTNATAGGKWALALSGEIIGGGLDSNPHLLFAQANGASSLITVDGASVATGDAGTTGITHLSLGAGNANGSTFGGYLTGGIALALVFNTDPTLQPEWADFEAYVESTIAIDVTPA